MTEASTLKDLTLIERVAKIISAIFHPLILPATAFTILIAADPVNDLSCKLIIGTVALIFSVVLVPGYIFWLKSRGIVELTDIIIREQHINPLAIALDKLILF